MALTTTRQGVRSPAARSSPCSAAASPPSPSGRRSNGRRQGDRPDRPGVDQTPPTPCPLTGEPRRRGQGAAGRPALAVKVENTPDAHAARRPDRAPTSSTRSSSKAASRGSSRSSNAPTPSGRTGAQRPHHRPQGPAAVQPASAARVLGRREPGREASSRSPGVVGIDEDDPRRRVHPRRRARVAAQPVRQHEQALGRQAEKRAKDEPAPEAIFTFDASLRRSPARRLASPR